MSTTPTQKTIRAEARECSCGHIGINDSHETLAACNRCEWSGPSPKEDHCPECERDGTMVLACPECGGVYTLLCEADINVDRAALTQGAGEAVEPVAHLWRNVIDGRPRVVMPDSIITADASWVVEDSLHTATQLQQAVACAVEECAQLCDKTYHQFIGPEFGEVRHGIAACAAAIRAKGTHD